jgi:hypothetical protein
MPQTRRADVGVGGVEGRAGTERFGEDSSCAGVESDHRVAQLARPSQSGVPGGDEQVSSRRIAGAAPDRRAAPLHDDGSISPVRSLQRVPDAEQLSVRHVEQHHALDTAVRADVAARDGDDVSRE